MLITRAEFCVDRRPCLQSDVAVLVQQVLQSPQQSRSLQGLSASCTAVGHQPETANRQKQNSCHQQNYEALNGAHTSTKNNNVHILIFIDIRQVACGASVPGASTCIY